MDSDNTNPVASGSDPVMGNAGATTENVPQFESEADRWKYYSRQNENKWKTASEELTAATAKATELESTLAQMRQEHSLTMASIELNHIASQQGIQLSAEALSKINVSAFLDENGGVDTDQIDSFLSSFGSPNSGFPKVGGIGPQHTGSYSPPAISLDARSR